MTSGMKNIRLIKKSLLMSNGFMQLWRNPEKYRKFIEQYAEDIRKNKGNVEQTDRQYANTNYLNDYDFNAIHSDYKKYRYGTPLSNEEGFKDNTSTPQEQTEQTDVDTQQPEESVAEPSNEAETEVPQDNTEEIEQPQKTEREIDLEDAPYYDTEVIPVRKLDKGDVLYIDDDWWVVIRKSRVKTWIQNIWDKKIKTFRKDPNDKVEILTDESVDKIINEFKDENLEHKLPKILKQ